MDRDDLPVCPDCGGIFTIDPRGELPVEVARAYHVRTDPILVRVVIRPIAMCTRCGETLTL